MIRKITIRTNILTNFLLLVGSISLALLGLQYHFSQQMALEATEKSFRQIAQKVAIDIQARDTLARESLQLIEMYPQIEAPVGEHIPMALLRRLAHAMERNDNIYTIYTGHGDGDLFELINMRSAADLHTVYRVPKETRWLLLRVFDRPQGRVRTFDYYDAGFTHLGSRSEPSSYRTNPRPWYEQALHSSETIRTDPYLFANLKQMGISYAKRIGKGEVVLALDFTLTKLGALFRQLKFDPTSRIVMFDAKGEVIASSEPGNGAYDSKLTEVIGAGNVGSVLRYEHDGVTRFGMVVPLSDELGKTTWLGFSVDAEKMLRPYLEKIGYALAAALLLLLLSLPLIRWMTARIVKPVLALKMETDKIKLRHFDEVRPVQTNIIELEALSESLTSMAESIRAYQQSQKEMMDAFIKVIADAIDAKSPYTGGHCKRVPVIAMMLARVAEEQKEGAFADFALGDAEAWEEFERGTWLHDCGKITTPEYVVDKATKLETIYNRIHEIRTRFEVLWRDVQIEYFTRMVSGEDKTKLEAWMQAEHEKLLEDFAFIAEANLGGEFMRAEHQQRIREIGARTWVRHFDDRLGLSERELMRYEGVAERPVPCVEKLLDDKPEHKIARENFDEAAYRAQGFKTPVPELLYDYGELYNLCLEKGTLTDEERFKINEHVIMSIKMLEQMPLPENMKKIPYYAGTHHETLDGHGYPRRLCAEELSVEARITAIADIFEALTASDRPYKKAKTLSESLRIMSFMVKEEHIDAELFALFLRSGVYMEYAKAYLKPEQIDEVDIEAYLS